jgi:hypothetical protein
MKKILLISLLLLNIVVINLNVTTLWIYNIIESDKSIFLIVVWTVVSFVSAVWFIYELTKKNENSN